MRQRSILLCIFSITVLWLLIVSNAAAATITVSVSSAQAQAGGTVDVPIQVSGANGLGAVHLELTYDPRVLTAKEVTRGALAGSNALVESNVKQPGRVVIGIVSLDGIKGDGVIATARFQVVGNAGQSTEVKFENNLAWERESHAEVLVNSQAGTITIAAAVNPQTAQAPTAEGMPAWLIPAVIAGIVLLLVLGLVIFLLGRRRQQPQQVAQPAYYAPPAPMSAPAPRASRPDLPARASAPPPMNLPESKTMSANPAAFQRAEDEYFRLKGQLAMNRLTREQFENALRELMVTDAEGRYWILGADTGKWYVHEGDNWVERQPYNP